MKAVIASVRDAALKNKTIYTLLNNLHERDINSELRAKY